MVLEAHLRIRHTGCISEKMLNGAEAAQISADRDADILVMHAPDEALVQEFVDYLVKSQDRPPRIVSRTPGSVIVRGRNPPWGVTSTILSHDCTILWPAVWSGGFETYAVVAPDRPTLDRLVRSLERLGPVHIERVSEVAPESLNVSVPLADLTSGLTERQLLVLRRAIEEGYYETPRGTSAEALAKSFGIGRSTLEEHLRKSEQRVLQGFARVLASQPALAKSATRKSGRPKLSETPRPRDPAHGVP